MRAICAAHLPPTHGFSLNANSRVWDWSGLGLWRLLVRLVIAAFRHVVGAIFPHPLQIADLSTRQYARLVDKWVCLLGLDPAAYSTHSLRRTKVALLYK